MKLSPQKRKSAFSLMELLVVIGIMILVAGMVVGLAGVVGEKKKISRTQVEREKLVTLIESYKTKIGVYPPQNPDPNNLGMNTLIYELAGAVIYPPATNPEYETPFGTIDSNTLFSVFGVRGIINASTDPTEVKRLLKSLRPDQKAEIAPDTLSLVVPIDGVNGQPNPWRYMTGTNAATVGTNILHNRESFDLWAEIDTGKKVITIGNWKD